MHASESKEDAKVCSNFDMVKVLKKYSSTIDEEMKDSNECACKLKDKCTDLKHWYLSAMH